MKVSRYSWEKLLLRWSGMQPIPEVKLLVAIAASIIAPEKGDPPLPNNPRHNAEFRSVFDPYMRILHLDPVFVLDQMDRAEAFAKRTEDEGVRV